MQKKKKKKKKKTKKKTKGRRSTESRDAAALWQITALQKRSSAHFIRESKSILSQHAYSRK